MPGEPELSIGEIGRTIVRLEQTLNDLAGSFSGMKDSLDARYQRRDLAEAEAANLLARIASVVDDVAKMERDADDDRRARVAGTRWGIGLALTAIGLLISATAVLIVVLPGMVQP